MTLAIMQPYFFPYIGYFQLIAAADVFIVYDNIKYTKRGWINRNRMLQNGKDALFTLPLKSASDASDVRDRELAPDFNRGKFLNQFVSAYKRAPYFESTFPIIEEAVRFDNPNLFAYIHHSIVGICRHLEITTEIRISSSIPIDHQLKNRHKVLALCEASGADRYINPIGGTELYDAREFNAYGIELKFLKSEPFAYRQFGADFIPWLSIVDVMMFNDTATIAEYLKKYTFL